MKFYTIELNGEEVQFRLTSADSMEIEKKTGVKLLDFMEDYSITAIITLLKYMRKSSVLNFSEKEAQVLYDTLIDNGYTMETIIFDLIYEAMVVSGFLKKEELDKIKSDLKEKKEAQPSNSENQSA